MGLFNKKELERITELKEMVEKLEKSNSELTNKLNELRTVNDTEEEIAENYKEHIHKRGV